MANFAAHGHSAAMEQQQLLYNLRSPTLPLSDKLQLVETAFAELDKTPSLAQLVRDWTIDLFLRSRQNSDVILSLPWWHVLARATAAAPSTSSSPSLPVWTSFVTAYAASEEPNTELVTVVNAAWTRLATPAMRKATIDNPLAATATLLTASCEIVKRQSKDSIAWQNLMFTWLKAFRSVLDLSKTGKKVPQHVLSQLSSILPLLDMLDLKSPVRQSLLSTVQLALFNADNLRRGIARESYHAGNAEMASVVTNGLADGGEGAAGELLGALDLFTGDKKLVLSSVPIFTSLYFKALADHATTLFPLPAKQSNFPTASAARSALEIYSLQKRRALAASWTRGVAALIGWLTDDDDRDLDDEITLQTDTKLDNDLEAHRATALASVLSTVEADDVHRDGILEGWSGTLESLADCALVRLEIESATLPQSIGEPLMAVLAASLRLSFAAMEKYVPRALVVLASTPASTSSLGGSASLRFLADLLAHHTKSVTLPVLLSQLSSALSNPASPRNSLLTTHGFITRLEEAIENSMASAGGVAARKCFEALLSEAGLQSAELAQGEAATKTGDDGEGAERSRKRRKVSPSPEQDDSKDDVVTVTTVHPGRLRILTSLIKGVPAKVLPLSSFERLQKEGVRVAMDKLTSAALDVKEKKGSEKKSKGKRKAESQDWSVDEAVMLEWLQVGREMRERVRTVGLDSEDTEKMGELWPLRDDTARVLTGAVGASGGGLSIASAQLLLQAIEAGDFARSPATAHMVLDAVLAQFVESARNLKVWNGLLRGIKTEDEPCALWEAVSRRWMAVVAQYATPEQLDRLAQFVVATMSGDSPTSSLTLVGSTMRLLRRADFYELRPLQGPLSAALLQPVTVSDLTSPGTTLVHLASSKRPKSLRSLDDAAFASATAAFDRIASLIPMEYLSKGLRGELIDRALSIDLWTCSMARQKNEATQLSLRRFVALATGASQGASASADALLALVKSVQSEASTELANVTVEVYQRFVRSSVLSFKSDRKESSLVSYPDSMEKPFGELYKRVKKESTADTFGDTLILSCEERAVSVLYDALSSGLGPVSDLPLKLVESLQRSIKSASKSFSKAITALQVGLEHDNSVVFQLGHVLEACKSLWAVKSWLAGGKISHDEVESFATFAQVVLRASLLRLRLRIMPPASALTTAIGLLELLSLQTDHMRTQAVDSAEVPTQPFEIFVACHLTFRSILASIPGASIVLEDNLRHAVSVATHREYAAVLASLTETIKSAVGSGTYAAGGVTASLSPALQVTLVVLRDGPEGSSKVSGACLSDILRLLAPLLSRYGPSSTENSGEAVSMLLLSVSQFVENICGEKPMLLSRLNVSAALSLVSRMLLPMGTTAAANAPSPSPTSPETAAALFQSLVSTVSHLVRHRKDHISPLFPHLVATLAGFVSALRRSGYGTTGTSSEDDVAAIGLGKRAEREARATFPFWVWEGGMHCVAREEGQAVGRLLGSLAAKTATTLKRKSTVNGDGSKDRAAAGTVSLVAPLSKHAPFIILPYLRACAHPTCPIPSSVRKELQGGWFEVMDAMGKWERESLMSAFLGAEEETERAVLRSMWKSWEKERYKGN